jgi:putative ABC transport system substrate-binding protein
MLGSNARRRSTAAVLVAAGALGLAACGSSGNAGTASSGSGGSSGKRYSISVMALSPFPQLTDMVKGFKESAAKCGLNAKYDLQYGQGQQSQLQVIAKQDVQKPVSLFFTLDTPATVTAAAQTKSIPIVAGAPSYPVQAGVAKSLDQPGGNVTGGTDHIDPQLLVTEMLKALPNVKSVGVAYNPSEQNSAAFEQGFKPALQAKGIKLVQVPVASTGDVQSAVKGLITRVDALVIGNDNTTLAAQGEIAHIALQNKKPLISSIAGAAKAGALMDLGADYLFLGRKDGEQACQILLHGGKPGTMPFTQITKPVLTINTKTARALGTTIPSSVLSGAATVS